MAQSKLKFVKKFVDITKLIENGVKKFKSEVLKKQFPNLTNEELENVTKQGIQNTDFYHRTMDETNNIDQNSVQVLYFNYKINNKFFIK